MNQCKKKRKKTNIDLNKIKKKIPCMYQWKPFITILNTPKFEWEGGLMLETLNCR